MWRASLLAVAVVSLALSGCLSDDDKAEPKSDELDPIVHTRPGDLGNVSEEEAQGRSHIHDYWGGAREIVVFAETFMTGCTLCGTGASMFRFEPPGGAVFPQGTRWVNVTIEWEDDLLATYAEPHLWIETAADHEPRDHGVVASGDTFLLEVDENASDLPHELLSNWAFEIRVRSENEMGLWRHEGEVFLSATAARGHPIPVFPPHPDKWGGATEFHMFEVSEMAMPFYSGTPDGGNAGSTWLGPYHPDDGVVVPYDAALVEVVVEYDEAAVRPFLLGFHGSDARDWTLVEPDESSSRREVYGIPITNGLPDGPYTQQSHWVFEVFSGEDDPSVFVGGFTMTATVYQTAP